MLVVGEVPDPPHHDPLADHDGLMGQVGLDSTLATRLGWRHEPDDAKAFGRNGDRVPQHVDEGLGCAVPLLHVTPSVIGVLSLNSARPPRLTGGSGSAVITTAISRPRG